MMQVPNFLYVAQWVWVLFFPRKKLIVLDVRLIAGLGVFFGVHPVLCRLNFLSALTDPFTLVFVSTLILVNTLTFLSTLFFVDWSFSLILLRWSLSVHWSLWIRRPFFQYTVLCRLICVSPRQTVRLIFVSILFLQADVCRWTDLCRLTDLCQYTDLCRQICVSTLIFVDWSWSVHWFMWTGLRHSPSRTHTHTHTHMNPRTHARTHTRHSLSLLCF